MSASLVLRDLFLSMARSQVGLKAAADDVSFRRRENFLTASWCFHAMTSSLLPQHCFSRLRARLLRASKRPVGQEEMASLLASVNVTCHGCGCGCGSSERSERCSAWRLAVCPPHDPRDSPALLTPPFRALAKRRAASIARGTTSRSLPVGAAVTPAPEFSCMRA